MRKLILAGMALAMLAVPAAASADVTNNKSTNDCHGYATAVATHGIKDGTFDGTGHGIGSYRSTESGEYKSNLAVNGCETYPDWVNNQTAFGPISNNG